MVEASIGSESLEHRFSKTNSKVWISCASELHGSPLLTCSSIGVFSEECPVDCVEGQGSILAFYHEGNVSFRGSLCDS